MDLIVIHGSPGNGKTTVSKKLHDILKSPWFEFGWIPEFTHLNPHTQILPKLEEQIAFENLVLVSKNYMRHGFENIIFSDLQDIRMLDIPVAFAGHSYVIITLYSESDDVIKERILTRDNGNDYSDFEESIRINKKIKNRKPLPNEYKIRSDNQTVDQIAAHILDILKTHKPAAGFASDEYSKDDYFTYFDENGLYSSALKHEEN